MVQWINVLQNNSFINPTQLPLLCEKTGAIALAQPGLMAGWLSSRLSGRRMLVHLEIFKSTYIATYWMKHWKFSGVQKGTVSL